MNDAVKQKLEAEGLSSKYYTIYDAKSELASVADSSTWDPYIHSGKDSWYLDLYEGEEPDIIIPADFNHVQMSNNGQTITFYGYTAPAYKDFMLYKGATAGKKTLTFDLDTSKVNYHSMEGGGFLFNSKIENGYLTGYAALYIQNANDKKKEESTGNALQLYKNLWCECRGFA